MKIYRTKTRSERYRYYLCDNDGKLWRIPKCAWGWANQRAFPQYARTKQKQIFVEWWKDNGKIAIAKCYGTYFVFDERGCVSQPDNALAALATFEVHRAQEDAAQEKKRPVADFDMIRNAQQEAKDFQNEYRWPLSAEQTAAVYADVTGERPIPILKPAR